MKKKEQFWEQLFNTHYHNVYIFFLKKLGSSEDASDASQETFMRVVSHNGTARLDSPAGYIWRTAQNMLREIKRTKDVHVRWIVSKTMDLDKQESQAPCPDEVIRAKQMHDNILNVLYQLSPRCREVFILHRFKGLSHREIADQLNISPKTVESHMAKAILFFHKHLHLP